MRIQPFQAVYPNINYITSPESFFGSIKSEYPEYKSSGFFNKTPDSGIYIYRIQKKHRHYTGVVACADINDFIEGKIKKHENTLAAKEQKQLQLMLRREAQVKPVLLTYPQSSSIDDWISRNLKGKKPLMEVNFEDDDQSHIFWEIKDPAEISLIQQLFATEVPATYIADGHHRTSTTALMYRRMMRQLSDKPYNLLLSAFFPTSELEILDFNRVIDGLEEVSLSTFMAKMSQIFNIEILTAPAKPRKKHELTMYVNREWFRLTWRKKVIKSYTARNPETLLDANMLDEKVLRDILDIVDVRTDTQVHYIEGPKGVEGVRRKTLKKPDSVGFCLYPVEIKDLLAVADAKRSMPPKSTWFEPRIKNGLIVYEF